MTKPVVLAVANVHYQEAADRGTNLLGRMLKYMGYEFTDVAQVVKLWICFE